MMAIEDIVNNALSFLKREFGEIKDRIAQPDLEGVREDLRPLKDIPKAIKDKDNQTQVVMAVGSLASAFQDFASMLGVVLEDLKNVEGVDNSKLDEINRNLKRIKIPEAEKLDLSEVSRVTEKLDEILKAVEGLEFPEPSKVDFKEVVEFLKDTRKSLPSNSDVVKAIGMARKDIKGIKQPSTSTIETILRQIRDEVKNKKLVIPKTFKLDNMQARAMSQPSVVGGGSSPRVYGTKFAHGAKSSISTTALQLTTDTKITADGVLVKASLDNAGIVYVGDSNAVTNGSADATDGFPLRRGESVTIPIYRPSGVWVIGSAATQKVFWIAL